MAFMLAEAKWEDWVRLKQEIVAAAPSMGIDKIGFTTADPFLELKDRLERRREQGYECGFEEKDIDKRVHPELIFSDPRSIIAIAVAYPSKLKEPPRSEPGKYRGMIARTAWGGDYHFVLRERLTKLEAFIRERVPDARMESMVDTGALVDRAVAERAGIGWSGKNCAIITPEFGSWVYLGEMITNLPFSPDVPVVDGCGDCTRCMDACPTGAIVNPGELDATRCISFLTQKRGTIEDELMDKMGNSLYGCDICQTVCPPNKGLDWTHQLELQPEGELVKPLLTSFMGMGNREYKELYGWTASAWRGKKPIQRNAIVALGNFKDKSAVPILIDIIQNDTRPDIRATSVWSLGKIGGDEAEQALKAAMEQEKDEFVRYELTKTLEKLGVTTGG